MSEAQVVRKGDENRYYGQVKDFAHKREQRARRTSWFLGVCLAISLGTNFVAAYGTTLLFPLVRVEEVFFGVHEDGTIDSVISGRNLTDTERDAALKSAAFTYVKACEGYSYADAQYNYDVCEAMSDKPVREAFEAKWFLPNGKDAPDSPQKLYGKNGQIDIRKIGEPVFVRDHVIQVRFKRIARKYDDAPPPEWICKAPVCTTWTSTLDFTLLDRLPNGKSGNNNPLHFFVIRHQLNEGAG